jgi:hypothetical protein
MGEVSAKQRDKRKIKVWLRQGSKVETTKRTGANPLSVAEPQSKQGE